MNRLLSMSAAAWVVLAATTAVAQDPGSRQTREFVEAAAQSDRFEILEAQAVLARSADPQVRAFAERMIRDHETLADALSKATAKAGLKPPPMAISADQALLLGALQSQGGAKLDQTYLTHQMLSHRSALVVEQGYAAAGDDPVVREAAATATPVIAAHLNMAERMRASLGGS